MGYKVCAWHSTGYDFSPLTLKYGIKSHFITDKGALLSGGSPLFLDHTELRPEGRKIFFKATPSPPPPLSGVWMTSPPPYLKVWIHHCYFSLILEQG